jgi:hypothetical protein
MDASLRAEIREFESVDIVCSKAPELPVEWVFFGGKSFAITEQPERPNDCIKNLPAKCESALEAK